MQDEVPTDPKGGIQQTSMRDLALCLSGGGYRAMLFHVGALRCVEDNGMLDQVDRVSSVSGGSITAAVLALNWESSGPDLDVVERDLRSIAGTTLDWPSVVTGPAMLRSPARRLADLYDKHLFHGRTLQDLPNHPRFVFNTTNMTTGNLMRWSKPYAADYTVGRIIAPTTRLADVVAASSAFPPFLSPMRMKRPGPIVDFDSHAETADQPDHLWLTDGGVYDNLGLQTVVTFDTVLISDGGAPFMVQSKVRRDWGSQLLRTVQLMSDQIRRRRLDEIRQATIRDGKVRVYWSIDAPFSDGERATVAATPTRLRKLPSTVIDELIEHGYECARSALDTR